MTDPMLLLAWMQARGPGDIAARAIGECGPRGFRRKTESDAALAALIAAGSIVEVSARPRSFRVVEPALDIPAVPGRDDTSEPMAEQDRTNGLPIPAAEIRALLAERTAHHAATGLSDDATRYLAARDVFAILKADPRLASVQITPGRCNVCGGRSGDGFLRVGEAGVLVHPKCLAEHRHMIAERVDDLVVNALP